MKNAGTYAFDALVNLIGQAVLFLIGCFVWTNVAAVILWALCAAGFAVFLSVMERGAELRSSADFRHYLLFSVLPVNLTALVVSGITGAIEYNIWVNHNPMIYVYTPFYPIGIAAGTVWVTLSFIAVNRLTRKGA